jgi:hypothetical protein
MGKTSLSKPQYLHPMTQLSLSLSILDVGPSLKIAAQAVAQMDIRATAKVGLSYKVENIQFEFPKNDEVPSGFKPADQGTFIPPFRIFFNFITLLLAFVSQCSAST